jgi:hypothetical protein
LCEGVDAFLTALSVADQAGTLASQDDGSVGDDGAARVRDSAGNGGVLNLCAEGWPRESQKAKQGEESGKRSCLADCSAGSKQGLVRRNDGPWILPWCLRKFSCCKPCVSSRWQP